MEAWRWQHCAGEGTNMRHNKESGFTKVVILNLAENLQTELQKCEQGGGKPD